MDKQLPEYSQGIPSLLGELQQVANKLLKLNGIYDVLSYGWLDHDTPDGEYIGHSIWQTSPPFDPDWTALFDGRTIPYLPTNADEWITRSGEDFIGTMKFARRSIGLTLCYAEIAAAGSFDEAEEFWHEYSTSLLWLSIASDRLRDFFIIAAFQKTTKEYQKVSRIRCEYEEPFEAALHRSATQGKASLILLAPVASRIQLHRKERNGVVHVVATNVAKSAIRVLNEQRIIAKSGKPRNIYIPSIEELQEAATTMNPVSDEKVAAMSKVRSWYLDLIDASSRTFEFEYSMRVSCAT